MMVPKTIRFSLNSHKQAHKQIVCRSGSSEKMRVTRMNGGGEKEERRELRGAKLHMRSDDTIQQ